MQTFSLTTKLNNNSYTNLSLKKVIIILSDYYATYGDDIGYILESEQTGELISGDTLFTQSSGHKITFNSLFELLPYWNHISPITL